MAQFLRPDGVISQGSWINNHTAIDETTAVDSDLVYSQDNPNGSIFEVSLSNPSGTPGSGSATVRYRHGRVRSGALNGTGTATALDVSLMQGATVIASDAQQAPSGAWTTRTWVIPSGTIANITDWSDVRLQFTATGGGGSPSNRRGVGVTWAELEAQDVALVTHAATGVLNAGSAELTGSATNFTVHSSTGALSAGSASLSGSAQHNDEHPSSGVLTGQGSNITGSASRAGGTVTHEATGSLSAGSGAITGNASNFTLHSAGGALSGPGSGVSGSANKFRVFASTAALQGEGSNLGGSAALHRSHATTGSIAGGGSALAGPASRVAGPLTHVASGAFVAAGSNINGGGRQRR